MKTYKKILIAVGALVLVAAVAAGILYAVSMHKVPELERKKMHEIPVNYSQVYIVGQPPYTDKWIFDTPIGMEYYWIENHNGGNGIEFVLQQTKDGELVVLSEALPAKSNAADLYGKDVKVADLTLAELRKVNLAYDYVDEDGIQVYAGLDEDSLEDVSVLTFDEMLDRFDAANRVTIRMYLRFFDESQIKDPEAVLKKIYDSVSARPLAERVVFLPQSKAIAAAADKACPDLQRAATTDEAKALFRACLCGKTPGDLPYCVIYEKANAHFGSEKFIHYVRNLGLAIVVTDVKAEDVARYRSYRVTAIASDDAPTFIQLLKDAKTAERESKKAADSSAQQ